MTVAFLQSAVLPHSSQPSPYAKLNRRDVTCNVSRQVIGRIVSSARRKIEFET